MSIIRCKMCGGDLEVHEGMSFCTCEFCGTTQTIPTVKDEELQILFNRANVLRRKSEFDKAAEIYEKILQRSENESEAYWGLILCKYGIEYVEDPKTYKRIPTCHRTSFDAVTADEDYRNALKYADVVQRELYESEADAIDEIQRGIIALAQKEDPYDIFICYKEIDENGSRTQDSVIANDIYYHLKTEGFKVFYAAISLEDKLGSEYEPYIFSALSTSKVMLALGTKPEYFNAVWVKNEWSRFLNIMKKDRSRLLIPCYRDMDPYELPEEFAHLQAHDMSRIGFISDIVRGIKKVIVKDASQTSPVEIAVMQQTSVSGTTAAAQVKRGNMALEDHEWDKADGFFEEALNLDPECAEAYLGKLMAKDEQPNWSAWIKMVEGRYESCTTERLEACPENTEHIKLMSWVYAVEGYLQDAAIRDLYIFDRYYDSELSCRMEQKEKQKRELDGERLLIRAQQYAKGETAKQIEEGLESIDSVLDQRIIEAQEEDKANIERVKAAYESYLANADKEAESKYHDAESMREQYYQNCISTMRAASSISEYAKAKTSLMPLKGYKDADNLAEECQKEIIRLNEQKRLKEEWQAVIQKRANEEAARKRKKIVGILAVTIVLCVITVLFVTKVIMPAYVYKKEMKRLVQAEVGSTVRFGKYEQDNNTLNGKEPVEWVVLEKNGSALLVISKNALEGKAYNNANADTTWESSSLRTWLNSDFLDTAFSNAELEHIAPTAISAEKNPEYDTDSGTDTQDKVFLLSISEAQMYFESDAERKCTYTAYAARRGYFDDGQLCYWWLRSPGDKSVEAACISTDGSVYCRGIFVLISNIFVRPVLWINLKS